MQVPDCSQRYINHLPKSNEEQPIVTIRTPGELKNCIESAKPVAKDAFYTINLTIQNRPHMVFMQKYLKQNPLFAQALWINLLSVCLPDITPHEFSNLLKLNIYCIHLDSISLEEVRTSSAAYLAIKNCTRLKTLTGWSQGVFIENAPALTEISLPNADHVYLTQTKEITSIHAFKAVTIFAIPGVHNTLSLPKIKTLIAPTYTGVIDISRMPKLELLDAENASRITNVPYYSSKPEIRHRYQKLPTKNHAIMMIGVVGFLMFSVLSIAFSIEEANQCVVNDDKKHCFISGGSAALALISYVISNFVWEKILVPEITGIELDSWHPIWRGRSVVRF